MIHIRDLTVKNFMSVGNATQAINFDRRDLTLVLGENLDLGGDGSRNGTGKAQPLYAKIKTPTGWTTMGEIQIGDVVSTPDGGQARVTGVYPQGLKETYRIHFTDGRTADACRDHLWKVFSHSFPAQWKVMTTADLIEHNKRYKNHKNKSTYYKYVPLIAPCETTDIDLPLDPYFLGAMLGDGGMTVHGIGFTTADADMFDNMRQVLPENYRMTKNHYDKYGYSFTYIERRKTSDLRLALKNLGLHGCKSNSKFVPAIYKEGSIQQRIALIQGLVDTDGYVEKKSGSLTITTVSPRLAKDIQEVVQSIGGIATVRVKTNSGYKKNNKFIPCQDAYTISIMYHTPRDLSRLPRKHRLLPGDRYQYKNRKLRIDKIELIGQIDSQCIMIDHPEHLYITDNYVVTHNTTIINALSYALYGQALTNIRRDNLVNKTNNKAMLVSLDFSVNGVDYRVERGRKPNILKFYVNSEEQQTTDDSQGDSRETQEAIESILGMSHTMFKHVLALNTYTEPFLSLKANDQREIIEQLLGITLLSERAERIKELNRATKDAISQEEMRIRAVQEANRRIEEQISSLEKRRDLWNKKQAEDVQGFKDAIAALEHIDIELEVQAHRDLESYHAQKKQIDEHQKWIRQIDQDNSKLEKDSAKLKRDIDALKEHRCHACGQELHDGKQDEILAEKQKNLQEIALQLLANETQKIEHLNEIDDLGELGTAPRVFYDDLEQALNHRNSLDGLRRDLTNRSSEQDPYTEQISDMRGQALQEITYDTVNELTRVFEHQDFLLKLLTNKDSFVRKKIIEQNLSYLNNRLTHYLDRIGLPHQVIFQNDLTVEITELGRDLDFDNLSRGERNRLILSMSWAFRDVWESLYHPINVLFIDELIDSGMDTAGMEACLALLKKMSRERNKSIWLVSHRDELAGRVENILRVVKEHGFTSYNTDIDIV